MSSFSSREIVFLILKYLQEEFLTETLHALERESGIFFCLDYFEDQVQSGNWDTVEKYLFGFVKLEEDKFSEKLFLEIRKQKYLEALYEHDRSKALEILIKDLKEFRSLNFEVFDDLTQMLTMDNIREHKNLSGYRDEESFCAAVLPKLKEFLEFSSALHGKLEFPNIKEGRLRTLINRADLINQSSTDIVFLILQYLQEENLTETLHILESESGHFFNLKYFEDQVQSGNWDEVEKYLSDFINMMEDEYFLWKMVLDIRMQKYLEALDKQDRSQALEILLKDFKFVRSHDLEFYKEMTKLLALDNFRDHQKFSEYKDVKFERANLFAKLKRHLESNLVFHSKLQFAEIPNGRLRTLLNQSLNWKQRRCNTNKPCTNHEIESVQPSNTSAPSPVNPLQGSVPRADCSSFPPPGIHGPFQATPMPIPTLLPSSTLNQSSVTHPTASGAPIVVSNHPGTPTISGAPVGLGAPPVPVTNRNAAMKGPRVSDQLITSLISFLEGIDIPHCVNVLPVSFTGHGNKLTFNSPDELPKTLVRTLNQGSAPVSMDFHPQKHTLLLVGTNVGDIALWEVGSRERLALKNFKVWNLGACSMLLQSTLEKDPHVSVKRVMWSPDASLFGVAYSMHIVQIYSYKGNDDVEQHLEIEAHVDGVNDLAFSCPGEKQLYLVTCGDDKTIKVWDATTGARQYVFKGHEAPVYSLCASYHQNKAFIISTALDGKIRGWLFDDKGSRLNVDSLSRWYTTLIYNSDGTRLFSCGTSKDGLSHIAELDVEGVYLKRKYLGVSESKSGGVLQFDLARRFLAAGDDFSIKFWDMDRSQCIKRVDAGGGLPKNPQIRFNKDGSLLAASFNETGIKILANHDGLRLLKTFENLTVDASRSETADEHTMNPISENSVISTSTLKSKRYKVREIKKPSQCRSLKLPEDERVTKISSLMYTNSGNALLALASNGIHLLWQWKQRDENSNGMATASVSPQLIIRGYTMTNDVADHSSSEEAIHCFALPNNDYYVVSTSGAKISVFNLLTFRVMDTFMDPPPAASFLALYPEDNNIIAIGMDDSTVLIYDVKEEEVKKKLKFHSKRITGLAFSCVMNVLVSSGADAELCVWSATKGWKKQISRKLPVPPDWISSQQSDTRVQFHQDQIQFLVVSLSKLTICEAKKLDILKEWPLPRRNSSGPIFHATFSCDGHLVYASFLNGSVCVFTTAGPQLEMQCRINPSAYLPTSVSPNTPKKPGQGPVIAAHPKEPNQFAIGLSDGAVLVIEPLESEGNNKWVFKPQVENDSRNRSRNTSPRSQGSKRVKV